MSVDFPSTTRTFLPTSSARDFSSFSIASSIEKDPSAWTSYFLINASHSLNSLSYPKSNQKMSVSYYLHVISSSVNSIRSCVYSFTAWLLLSFSKIRASGSVGLGWISDFWASFYVIISSWWLHDTSLVSDSGSNKPRVLAKTSTKSEKIAPIIKLLLVFCEANLWMC